MRRPWLAAGLVAMLAAPIAGCGIDTEEAGRPTAASREREAEQAEARRSATQVQQRRQAPLPSRPAGQIVLAGEVGDASLVTRHSGATGSAVRVTRREVTEARAYADLCAGRADVIEVSTAPTQQEFDACRSRRLEIEPALLAYSDAIVLATRNERDLGGDCLTVAQARDIFRSGSQIRNWSQLGFGNVPLYATGREDRSESFELFGQQVLGIPDASLADVRSDYIVRGEDRRERREVTGEERIDQAVRRSRRFLARLRQGQDARERRRRAVRAAERRAEAPVLAAIEDENRIRAREKRAVSDPDALEARNRLRVEAVKRVARDEANRRFDAALLRRAETFYRRQLAGADRFGTVGGFRFSYYELFEDKLRPLEIDFGRAETESGQPVRLRDLSPADQRRILGRAPDAERDAVALGRPLEPGPDGRLPASRDRNGKEIFRGPSCVFPSQITITNGAYPLTQRSFLVVTDRSLRRPEVRRFLNGYFEQAQAQAVAERYVPITDRQEAEALAIVNDRTIAEQARIQSRESPVPSAATPAARDAQGASTTPTTAAPGTTSTAAGATTTTGGATTAPPATSAIPGVSARDGDTTPEGSTTPRP